MKRKIYFFNLSKSSASIRLIIVSKSYIRRKRLRTLIYTILMLTAAASFSSAQEVGSDARLLARAETHTTSVTYNIRNGKTFKSDTPRLSPAGSIDDTAGISRAVSEELDSGKSSGLSYNQPTLKAEDLPLVMSSPDRKTISVVLPPFLYFKTQF